MCGPSKRWSEGRLAGEAQLVGAVPLGVGATPGIGVHVVHGSPLTYQPLAISTRGLGDVPGSTVSSTRPTMKIAYRRWKLLFVRSDFTGPPTRQRRLPAVGAGQQVGPDGRHPGWTRDADSGSCRSRAVSRAITVGIHHADAILTGPNNWEATDCG